MLPAETPGGSEVAHLMRQIDEEAQAAQRGLTGLASGAARHTFITRKMEVIGRCGEQLERIVGQEEGRRIMCEAYTRALEGGEQHGTL